MANIQENFRILKKLFEARVSEERDCQSLELAIRGMTSAEGDLLNGDLWGRPRNFSSKACHHRRRIFFLRKLKPIEADLERSRKCLIATGNFKALVKALVAATPPTCRVDSAKASVEKVLTPEQVTKMERRWRRLTT